MNQKSWGIILVAVLGGILLSSIFTVNSPAIPVAEAQQLPRWERNWEFINHDPSGINYSPQTQISTDNVEHLTMKWMYPIPACNQLGGADIEEMGSCYEGTQAPPLVVDGIVYSILNRKTIIALDAATGDTVWTREHPGASNDDNSVQNGGRFPMTPEAIHTHGMNYIDGLLWFTDWGCKYTAVDAKTGDDVKEMVDMCLELPVDSDKGWGIPENSGLYGSLQPHPPVLYKAGNLVFYSQGGAAEGTWGGRTYISARDASTNELVWRTYLIPPCGDPNSCGPGKDGPLFAKEKEEWGQWLVDSCDIIWIQQIKSCELDQNMLQNDWGDMVSNSGMSNIWGQIAVDEEEGMIYFGTAQAGPDWNASRSPGHRLFGASVIALDANTGEWQWAHQTTSRDLWDFDCSWNTILTEATVNGVKDKYVIKGCKNGLVYIFDRHTGEALQVMETPAIKRSPCAELGDPRDNNFLLQAHQFTLACSRDQAQLDEHLEYGGWQACPATGCLESDIAYDPTTNTLYWGIYNMGMCAKIDSVENRGQMGLNWGAGACDTVDPNGGAANHTIVAYDANTGAELWSFFIDGQGYRGGTIVSNGVVWTSAADGIQRAFDAKTGEVLYQLQLGTNTVVQPVIGADNEGNVYVYRVLGGREVLGMGTNAPGAIVAYGLPDVIPEPEVIIERVEIEKQVVVEIEKQVVVEKEVPVEIEVEVIREVEIETISPVSYIAIGFGVVLVVIAGVLYTRK